MKRAIAAFLLALISMASITSVESSAASLIDKEIIVVNDVGSTEKTSFLTNSSGVLKCNSRFSCKNNPAQTIQAVQTLECKNAGGAFTSVNAWRKTVNAQEMDMYNTKSNAGKGTYRLKTKPNLL
ncbi:MAG: hypothetical protein IK999_16555 [Ruminococcus sp.]|nr:hypothetical protein [Ruminococcus sp.]